jgi:hypothetical protein
VAASGDTDLSVLTVAFSLVACAALALAEDDPNRAATALGAADGLHERAGLQAWASTRRLEADLGSRVRAANGDQQAFAVGARLTRSQALALIRNETTP